jgi:hypothetical protein
MHSGPKWLRLITIIFSEKKKFAANLKSRFPLDRVTFLAAISVRDKGLSLFSY